MSAAPLSEAQSHIDNGCELSELVETTEGHGYRWDYDCQITFTSRFDNAERDQ